MGGRITAVAVVESDPSTWYVATASGGLIKTVNNGTTFEHLFDREATVSIGDVAVAPSDPKTVWVGTGEANPRNSVSYGDGVYKSTDGGKTWTNMGLKKSFQIGKIAVHPKDPNTVYVGALGRLYGPNPERGLFKTTDGGLNWKNILHIDDKTGVIDFRFDPSNPETLVVGMWQRQRDAFDGFFGPNMEAWPTQDQYGPEIGHGPGGGLFKSTDGGASWKKLTAGLPTVNTGRIGLDWSRRTKGLLYAIVDTEKIGTGRPALSFYLGLTAEDEKDGLQVKLAPDDGPAGKAGIKEKDFITKLDDKAVSKYEEYYAVLATKKANDTIKFTVKRDGKEQVIPVKVVPKEGAEPKKETEPKKQNPPTIGIFLGKSDSKDGLAVGGVTEGGPADKAGIKAGDIITTVAGKKVSDQESLREALVPYKPGDKVKATVVTDKKSREVEVTLAERLIKGGGRPPAPNARPFLINGTVGGQKANVQDQQGKDGFQTGGVFVSKDGGETWARVNSVNPRPFYFSMIRIDPNDDNLLYVAGDTQLFKSTDGGKKFDPMPLRVVHPDIHALWIDPKDSRHMLLGCDGGFYTTYDRAATWDHLNVLALAQYYHVAVDNRKPYRILGGLQDNGSWIGPSHVLREVGPVNDDWGTIQGGDGFVCRVDPKDSDVVYSESQGGAILRQNLRTGERGGFSPPAVKQGEESRRNWNTPFIVSAHNSGIVYAASQYVSRSIKQGEAMKVISPEITRTKKGSGTALSESPRNPDVLWAGTDDGHIWVTKDAGQNWTNVSDNLKAAGLPGPRWVASLEASKVKDGRCYAALDAHRSDDDKPYLFVTEDFGATWTNITSNLPAFGSTRVLREDIVNPELLYAGTEFGIFASINRGTSWTKLNNNLPTVAVHEVAQPTTASEIVAGTHGRSAWILDVASLRQMSVRTEDDKKIDPLKETVTLFAPAPAVRWKLRADLEESPYSKNLRKFYGTNPDRRASIDYAVTKPVKELSLKIFDASDKLVWEFRNAAKDVGFHRQAWSLNRTGAGNAAVPAGTYRAVLQIDGKDGPRFVQPIVVENDPAADPKAIIRLEGERRSGEEEEEEEMKEEEE
jgi:photosystem II stability/assembly factor-like uncharacterized protein